MQIQTVNDDNHRSESKNTFLRAAGIFLLLMLLSLGMSHPLQAQQYDILLKGGHVMDSKNSINQVMDVAVTGDRISRVARNIPASQAEQVIDVRGLYVVPGLVDIHTHVFFGTDQDRYLSNSYYAVKPDSYSFKYGVTTMVDVGGAGWKNYETFKAQTIDNSATRVLSFLNIIGEGMKGGHFEQNLNDMDPVMTGMIARQNDWVVGIKIAHYRGHDWEPIERLVEAGERGGVPVMVDFGSANPPLSIETLVLEKLRPGDIYTHMYGGGGSGREAVLDDNGTLRPGILQAQERGVIFDVGHGGASFRWPIVMPAYEQGLVPDVISTDLHQGSSNAGMRNMLNVMSKFINMGMSLEDVIHASTWKPSQVIQREELGHLSEGAEADIAVLGMREGEFGFVDVRPPGNKLTGKYKLEAEMTLRAGRIMWDLNGLSASEEWRNQ
ncbi:MAG: amidohydrolase/deacetylase family metallohydrolase [Balneolaceae bacterium]